MGSMIIRPLTPEDATDAKHVQAASVLSITPEYYKAEQLEAWAAMPEHFIREELEGPRGRHCYGYFEKDALAGYIWLRKGPSIFHLHVHPDFQKRGIAKELLAYAEQKARTAGNTLKAHASLNALPFYIKHGFKEVEPCSTSIDGLGDKGTVLTGMTVQKEI